MCDLLAPYISLSHVVRSQAHMRSSIRIRKKISYIMAHKKRFFFLLYNKISFWGVTAVALKGSELNRKGALC